MEEILFVINPTSARGNTLRKWSEARQELIKSDLHFAEHGTSRAGEAAEITREALAKGISLVVAVGGDGTLNEVVNGYLDPRGVPINPHAAIGLFPSGTGSDFGRSLGIKSAEDAVRVITRRSNKVIDAASANFISKDGATTSRFFINLASFGLGGDVSAFVNGWRESLPNWVGGRARFIAAAVCALERYRNIPVEVQLDDEREIKITSNLIVIANGRFAGGGMMLAPHAELDDGLLDVILTDRATRFDVIRELPRIQRGGYLKNPKVTELRAREVSIRTDEPMAIDIDGEMAGYTPARLAVLPAAVRLAT